MEKFKILLLIGLLCTACKGGLPEIHSIPVDETILETAKDNEGADVFKNSLDHEDSKYYTFNDYYNMKSEGSLHILSGFSTYQQSTDHSDGCAVSLMVLNYFDIKTVDESFICKRMELDMHKRASAEQITTFFDQSSFSLEYNASSKKVFETMEKARDYFIIKIDDGSPIIVNWMGYWQIIIGIDTLGTDSPYDDVLIMADPYDVVDHYQDGYSVVPLARFFNMWKEDSIEKKEPYEQTYIVIYK